uniref:Neur_chan_LBD domain-containing protein n=1 Tax=Syphacia muris TaxID=451379 RepID=A0A0N5AYV8_9BILA
MSKIKLPQSSVFQYWKDDFLRWDPEKFSNSTEIFLSSKEIWIPEFSLYYSHHFDQAVRLKSDNDVRVNYTGHVRYYIPFSTESLCKLDVKFFPFDIQQCTLMFGSWAHSNESIKYALYTNLSLIDFYDNQEWELDMTHSKIVSKGVLYDYMDPPLYWDMIIMDVVVARQSFYYVFNLVIPSTIITLVAVIGFHTPSTSGRMRDAKYRLGIMTLMSMSVILLAIVEDMPKFSMSSSRRGRGSFSGIPLIGLYYFILLAVIGLSTVTTSMFVFLERDVKCTNELPWYLRWLSFDIFSKKLKRVVAEQRRSSAEALPTDPLLTFENTSFGAQNWPAQNERSKHNTRYVANSLAALVTDDRLSMYAMDTPKLKVRLQASKLFAIAKSPSGESLNKRLVKSYCEVTTFYENIKKLLNNLFVVVAKIENSVHEIREEVTSMIPQEELCDKWQTAITRLEMLSLVFYVSLVLIAMLLFFYHDWYCAIGHNPCNNENLKCSWMKNRPNDPSCLV